MSTSKATDMQRIRSRLGRPGHSIYSQKRITATPTSTLTPTPTMIQLKHMSTIAWEAAIAITIAITVNPGHNFSLHTYASKQKEDLNKCNKSEVHSLFIYHPLHPHSSYSQYCQPQKHLLQLQKSSMLWKSLHL